MEYNLENIQKSEVVSFEGVSYLDFRKSLIPDYTKVWKDISLAFLYILSLLTISLLLEQFSTISFWIYIPFLSLAIGFCIAHLRLFIHEAIHYNVHPNQKTNDVLANIILCSWFGKTMKSFRKKHWSHHYFLGTTNDSENSYFNNLTFKLIFNYLSGIYFIQQITEQFKSYKKVENKKEELFILSISLFLNSLIIFFSFYFDLWQSGIVWLLSISIFFPLFSNLRQILEHRNEWADPKKDFRKEDHGKTCRIFEGGIIGNTFGAAGFNRHMLHHWDPKISYTRFDELEDFLMTTSQCRTIISASKTTYFDTFLFLVYI